MSEPVLSSQPRVIVALDYADVQAALALVERLTPELCRLKIGKELFTRAGPSIVEQVRARGFDVFLDLKYHDIPHTVAQACKAAAGLGVWMLNVHAQGGRNMLMAARAAIDSTAEPRPLLIAVTLLTSLAPVDLGEVGLSGAPFDNVMRLAKLAHDCRLDGVVCSPQEVAALRNNFGGEFMYVTPGVRPAGAQQDDQQRIMTPRQAIMSGASYLVIGRPITQAADPIAVLQTINADLIP